MEAVIREQGSMFSTDMKTITGDPTTSYDENIDGIFFRGVGISNYPNGLFFLVQYSIVIAFFFLVAQKICKLKSSSWNIASYSLPI